MSFTRYNLKPFVRGDDWAVEFVITDKDNNAIDITGNTYWMTLKTNIDDSDPGAIQKSKTATGQDAINGIITITFDSDDTISIIPGTYFYDLQEVDQGGNVYTLLLGKVKVEKDVTRTI